MGLDLRSAGRQHSFREEIANAVTHGFGAVLAFGAMIVLIIRASASGSALTIAGVAIYGLTLCSVYGSSALHHGFRRVRPKQWFLMLDHCSIFLLIAGTNTPFAMVVLDPATGNLLLAGIWGFAAAGVGFTVASFLTPVVHRYDRALTVLYIATAWFSLFWAGEAFYQALPGGGFAWLVAGTAIYTAGVPFYQWKLTPYSHAVWHIFTLAGSAAHFWAIYGWVAPVAG